MYAVVVAVFLALSGTLVSTRRCASHQTLSVLRVVDGDTVAISVPTLPAPLDESPLLLRIRGVDCPERGVRSRCVAEAENAERATLLTEQYVAQSGVPTVILCHWDKYGGRVLGDLNCPGRPALSVLLTGSGLCVPYNGTGLRANWCEGTPCVLEI